MNITERKRKDEENDITDKNNKPMRYICVPNSDKASVISKYLKKTGLRLAVSSGLKIGEISKTKQTKAINNNSVIYSIPCNGCQKEYIGETGRGLKKRLEEHRKDVRHHGTSNSLVVHIGKYKHLPKWEAAKEVKVGLHRTMRRAMESAFISDREVTNHREGSTRWSHLAAKLALQTH